MTLDQAIAEVQQICGWRSDKVTEITRAIQYAQAEREKPNRTYPWFLTGGSDNAIVTVAGQMRYLLPDDFIEDSEEVDGNMYILLLSSPGTGTLAPQGLGNSRTRTVFIKKQSFENMQERYFGVWPYVGANPPGSIYDTASAIGPGVPKDYALDFNAVYLYPAPDGIYNISWWYWAKDATPALGQENKWLKNAPWLLIGDAAAKIAADLGNQQGLQTAMALSQSAATNLFNATINRGEAGRRRSLGSRL